MSDEAKLSRATAQRLSHYLRSLGTGARAGGTVSSVELARAVGASAAQVRRDLAALGHLGQRGVGYDAAGLAQAIRKTLGIDREWRACLVGVGNLARALLRHRGFRDQGFHVVALFDTDPAKIGQVVEGLAVEPLTSLANRVAELRVELGVLTVPPFFLNAMRVPSGESDGHSRSFCTEVRVRSTRSPRTSQVEPPLAAVA